MLDNVLEIETEAVLASMTKARSAAMVFFDFAAAFPSVAHAFIFITLSTLGVPRNIKRWSPKSRQAQLQAIRDADGNIHIGDKAVSVLNQHWGY